MNIARRMASHFMYYVGHTTWLVYDAICPQDTMPRTPLKWILDALFGVYNATMLCSVRLDTNRVVWREADENGE